MRFAILALSLLTALSSAHPTIPSDEATKAAVSAILDGTFNPPPPQPDPLEHTTTRPTTATRPNTTAPSPPSNHPPSPPLARNGVFLLHPSIAQDPPPDKHFHEATFDNHYDGRFTASPVSYSSRHSDLRNLIVAYLDTMRGIGIETWLMHGTLLGWWWNKGILAWDADADVQVTGEGLGFLGRYYNMSMWNFDDEGRRRDGGEAVDWAGDGEGDGKGFGESGRTYLLEINPYHHIHDGGEVSDKNVIDGRWIDTATGLYVDITCLWKAVDHEAGSGILTGKDGHSYREKYIFPLRETVFEGTEALVPTAYMEVLAKEYGGEALMMGAYRGHVFNEVLMEWVSVLPNSTLV